MAFPTSIPSNTDPTAGNTQNSPSHAQLHQSHNAEIVAIETKIGTGASTPAANKVLYATGSGTSAWQGLTSAQLSALLSDETGSGAAVFGTAPTISAPVVSTGTFASPVLTTPAVATSVNDANGNAIIKTPATAAAVNQVTITNAATGNSPRIAASGGDSAAHLNLRGLGLAKTVTIGAGAVNIFPYDYVASGCIITADSVGVNKNYSVSSGVVVINGNPLTVAAVSAQTVTASKDRYVDATDNGDGTAVLSTTAGEVTNNAASPALAVNSVRIGIVVAGATTIAAASSINQGQEDRVLPIASSIPYAVTDSLGNLICPRDPNRKLLGYRQIILSVTTASTSAAQATGLTCPVIVPTGRKVKVTCYATQLYTSSATGVARASIWDGTVGSGTQLTFGSVPGPTSTPATANVEAITTPTTASKTYNFGFHTVAAGTATLEATATEIAFIKVELE